MTRREILKLDTIIEKVERLHQTMDDQVARNELSVAYAHLMSLYNSAKRDCEATERA